MSKTRAGYVYGLLTALFFATYFLINRHVYLSYDVKVFQYTITFSVAGGVFALAGLMAGQKKKALGFLTQKSSLPLMLNGVLAGVAIAILVFGQGYTTAANASILATSTTITTAIFSWFMIKSDRFGRAQLIWFAVYLVGLYIAIVGLHGIAPNKGDIIILSSSILLGFTNVYSKLIMRLHAPRIVGDVRLITAAIFFTAVGLLVYGSSFLVTNAGAWPLVAGFFMWLSIRSFYASIDRINPSRAIIVTSTHPVITPIAGAILFAEPYYWTKFIGAVVILVSIIKINSTGEKKNEIA